MGHHFTILGAPRTKKNHSRIVPAGKRLRLLPSRPHEIWAKSAIMQLRAQWRQAPLGGPVGVAALFYREANTGDLVGYLQALGDALEHARVLGNDRQIVSWDGSRLLRDAANPRIECVVLGVG